MRRLGSSFYDCMVDSPSDLNFVADWAISLMESLGSVGAGVAVALENLFPPIPSEVILPLAGFTASRGTFTLWEVLVWTTIGSVVGALVLYGLGAWLGPDRLRRGIARIPLLNVADVDRAEEWFARHGSKAVFFGRMIPFLRSLISIPAGVERMPVLRFVALTLGGSVIWNAAFVLAGYYLGENWEIVERYADAFKIGVLLAVGALLGTLVIRRIRQQGRAPMLD